jgi:predicted phosphodiesterase
VQTVNQDEFSHRNLADLHDRSPVRPLGDQDRIVIFSDLHMGNGSRMDDFVHNGDLFASVLSGYYAPHDYHLVLNGDVEDLQRFGLRSVVRRWPHVYEAFKSIAERAGLTRIVGNHDLELLAPAWFTLPADRGADLDDIALYLDPVLEGLRLRHQSGELFIFHGHQTSQWYEKHNHLVRLALRYIANPLRIGNYTVAADSKKRFRTERRVYSFASSQKILAVIGHTHRPLFESMSKTDSLKFEIERLCRKYPKSKKKEKIERRIGWLKAELIELQSDEGEVTEDDSLYREHLLVPSMFNSGCVLGKRGMTSLEIEEGRLRLVYWYDARRKQKYLQYRTKHAETLPNTSYRRVVIKEETLDYIFSRIHLLA